MDNRFWISFHWLVHWTDYGRYIGQGLVHWTWQGFLEENILSLKWRARIMKNILFFFYFLKCKNKKRVNIKPTSRAGMGNEARVPFSGTQPHSEFNAKDFNFLFLLVFWREKKSGDFNLVRFSQRHFLEILLLCLKNSTKNSH